MESEQVPFLFVFLALAFLNGTCGRALVLPSSRPCPHLLFILLRMGSCSQKKARTCRTLLMGFDPPQKSHSSTSGVIVSFLSYRARLTDSQTLRGGPSHLSCAFFFAYRCSSFFPCPRRSPSYFTLLHPVWPTVRPTLLWKGFDESVAEFSPPPEGGPICQMAFGLPPVLPIFQLLVLILHKSLFSRYIFQTET